MKSSASQAMFTWACAQLSVVPGYIVQLSNDNESSTYFAGKYRALPLHAIKQKAAKCATPLILNRILPKRYPETRVWGYCKSEGIKSNFHLYKGVEGHDSCYTNTANWVKFDLPISV